MKIVDFKPFPDMTQLLGGTDSKAGESFIITFGCFLIFFYFMAALFEKHKPKIGHETCATVILGIVWSVCFYWLYSSLP